MGMVMTGKVRELVVSEWDKYQSRAIERLVTNRMS